MKPFRALVLYLAAAFLGGAALAPWVYQLVHAIADRFGVLTGLAGQPFHRYVNRCLYVVAIAGLWPLLKTLALRSVPELGLSHLTRDWRRIFGGFGVGFATLAVVATAALMAGARQPNTELTLGILAKHLLNATASGVVVALLEEFLFRGVAFGGLRKSLVPVLALLLSSALYSAVHFYERPPAPEVVTWTTGFETLWRMFHGIAEVHQLVPGFFSLLIAGMMLGWVYHSTGTLWFSVGLHAGWVFWLKSYGALTRPVPGAIEWVWGTGKLYDGWAALGVLALTGLVLRWRFPPPRGVIQWK